MIQDSYVPESGFERWDADDALDALHLAGLDIDHVEQARWPASAPQPRSHRQAFTFRSPGAVDPHLLLVFDAPEALEEWRLWLSRYWKARPYLSIRDNILLLVSRDLSPHAAAQFHDALASLRAPEPPASPSLVVPTRASAPDKPATAETSLASAPPASAQDG